MAVVRNIYYWRQAGTWYAESMSLSQIKPYGPATISGGALHGDGSYYYILSNSSRYILYVGDTIGYGGTGRSDIEVGGTVGDQLFADSFGWRVLGGTITITGGTVAREEGNRVVTLSCTKGGTISSPSVGGGDSIVAVTRPAGDMAGATNFLTVTAGDPSLGTGTLTSRGYTPGTWVNWTWPSTVLTSGQQDAPGRATEKTITLTLLAGRGDATVTANFTRSQNSASTWSPKAGNVIIHLLNATLGETENSLNAVANSTTWSAFRAKGFSAIGCNSGAASQSWYATQGGYTSPVYLMNVATANFSVTPVSGMRVYAWKVESAAGVMTDFGSANTATLSGFSEGCKVHLYLTSATPNPRIVYDGFDTAAGSVVPSNQNVRVAGAYYGPGAVWTSASANASVSVTLSPVAWATKGLGQKRSVIVDGGTPTVLANVAGTGASVTSSATPYSVNRVKFKQTALPKDGTLSVTYVLDTLSAEPGVTINVTQAGTLLGSIFGTGVVAYYAGDEPIRIAVTVYYGEENPSNFILGVSASEYYDGDKDLDNGLELVATGTTRAVTVRITEVVNVGALDAVAVNLTRDISVGSEIATSAGPVTQCYAGAISVTMTENQSSAAPLYIECSAAAGYTLKSIRIVDALTGLKTYYAGVAPRQVTAIKMTSFPKLDDGEDLKVILIVAADIVGTPAIQPMLPDDLGKFSASVVHIDTVYPDFRVGDIVKLSAAPVTVSGSPMTGVAIGSPTFNDLEVSPVRTGTSVEATVTLGAGANVFKVPVYAQFETSSSPAGAGTPTLTTAWDVTDTLVISAATYYRIGSVFTVTAPLTSTGYTVISARVGRRAVVAGFGYVEVGILSPVVASSTTRTFTSILRGPSECVVTYAQGVQYPEFSFAAYDYTTGAYITQGVRPNVTTTAVSPAALSDNTLEDVTWPETSPGDAYEGAAFLVREVTTTAVLPQVELRVSSSVSARLEVWDATTGLWVAYTSTVATLDVAFTFFRIAVGDAPEDLVDVVFETAVDGAGTAVQGCVAYATSGVVYDGNFALPNTVQARARYVLHVRVTPPYGYVVTGWFVDDVLSPSGAALSVVVLDTGLTLKPQVAIRSLAATSVMVLNGDSNHNDEGIWVSKLFRAQYPWKPLTAHVVVRPENTPVTLGVLKDGGEAPEALELENPGTVAITVTDDKMRRLPPGQIQKTRFVRYMVVLTGAGSVSSVAIGSGAETMKGGH